MWISEYMLESGRQQCQNLSPLIEWIQSPIGYVWSNVQKKKKRKLGVKEVYCLTWWKGIWDCDIGHHVMPGVLPCPHASVVLFHIIEFHLLH